MWRIAISIASPLLSYSPGSRGGQAPPCFSTWSNHVTPPTSSTWSEPHRLRMASPYTCASTKQQLARVLFLHTVSPELMWSRSKIIRVLFTAILNFYWSFSSVYFEYMYIILFNLILFTFLLLRKTFVTLNLWNSFFVIFRFSFLYIYFYWNCTKVESFQ